MFGRWLTLIRGLVGSQRIGEHGSSVGQSGCDEHAQPAPGQASDAGASEASARSVAT